LNNSGRRPGNLIVFAFVAGLAAGWLLIGWLIWPVEYSGARIQHLDAVAQEPILLAAAELYARNGDADMVHRALDGWNGEVVICQMAGATDDLATATKLQAMANVITGRECEAVMEESDAAAARTDNNQAMIVVLSFLLLVLLILIVVVQRERTVLLADESSALADAGLSPMSAETASQAASLTGQLPLSASVGLAREPTSGQARKLSPAQLRRQRLVASMRRIRSGWSIFAQSRIAVTGCVLLLIFGTLPFLHVALRATIWDSKDYDPIFGFEMDSMPNPAPPSWVPKNWLAPDDSHRFDLNRPSFEHLLGTDSLGRDVLSTLMASTLTTFIVGITAAVTTAVFGIIIAALSSYYRGLIDAIFTHISDAFLLLPPPIFMIAVGIFLRSQRTTIFEMIYQPLTGNSVSDTTQLFLQPFEFGLIYGVIAGAGGAAIVLRSHGLKVMNMSFVEASRVAGARGRHIIWSHLIPHMLPLAAIYMLVNVTGAVVADGFLAFFGLNPNPLNWGTMIYNAFTYSTLNFVIPWLALAAPAIAISLFTAAFYMVSRGLHLVVEPRLRDEPDVEVLRRP